MVTVSLSILLPNQYNTEREGLVPLALSFALHISFPTTIFWDGSFYIAPDGSFIYIALVRLVVVTRLQS